MEHITLNTEQKRFTEFTKDLAKISKKYGIVIQAVGGVHFSNPEEDKELLQNLSYENDATSGDLTPLNYFTE